MIRFRNIGRHLAEHASAAGCWTVTGISRHGHDVQKVVDQIAADQLFTFGIMLLSC
jgi:hypothetical protein